MKKNKLTPTPDLERLRLCLAYMFKPASVEHVVRAVNVHEDLLSATKRLLKIAYREADGYTDALQSVIYQAEQAIAKAESNDL